MSWKLDPGPLRLVAAAGMTVLAACGSTPKESYYTLAAPAMESAAASAVSVYVGLAALPEAVDRNPMVVRKGPNQVDIDDFHRWAEPLKAAIPRVLASNIARELGGAQVSSGRGGAATGVDYRVAVDISRFDSSFAEGAELEATWTVTPKSGGPAQGRTVARAPAPSADHAGVAAAHSQALAQLAREIAAAISRRPSSPAPNARGG
jgi:uncharacterized lipoprotein YmbA